MTPTASRRLDGEAMPKEHPIPFTGEMVRAVLDGSKTQTRRVVKPQGPTDEAVRGRVGVGYHYFTDCNSASAAHFRVAGPVSTVRELGGPTSLVSPYGSPGDLLWVRERQRVIEERPGDGWRLEIRVRYEADGTESGWLPYPERLKGVPVVGKCLSYGGYRESSRITLAVTDVRVERLQEITGRDVLAEGVPREAIDKWQEWLHTDDAPGHAFGELWDSINAKRGYGWATNPWVWVVSFRRADGEASNA